MKKEDLKKLAKDPRYISGIYNYCDRWCERCPFTSRCLNCTLLEEQFGDLDKTGELNEAFWQKFSETLQNTMSMLQEMAEALGIDLDSMDMEKDDKNKDSPKKDALVHLISHTSRNYAKSVDQWFHSNEYLLVKKENEINRVHLVSVSNHPIEEAIHVKDAAEVIRWYQYQIHVKLQRAIQSAVTEENIALDEFPKDSDGSAKVALIGLDRSMSAWKILLSAFPEQEKQILNFIVMLENIKNRVEVQFPHARDFIRPGFDEIISTG